MIRLFLLASLPLAASVPLVFEKENDPPRKYHEADYKLGWDIDFSPYSGGEDLLFATRAIERLEGYIIGDNAIAYSKQTAARLWRLVELFFGYLPLNYFTSVVQHEIFGHGYRIRSINSGKAQVESYHFGTPIPYGHGGGATYYTVSDDLTTTEETAISMAGVESTAIMAEIIKLKWLEANWIDPRQTVLYVLNQNDLNLYIGSLKAEGSLDGHDINEYIHSVNYTYTDGTLYGSTLRALSWINLADPFTYYAIYSWFHYISTGRETAIPMIPIYDWGYLPGLRLGLAPFGPELFLENYLLYKHMPIYFYLKGGLHAKNNYYGFGFYAPQIWNFPNWTLGARLDCWKQPQLLLFPGSVSIFEIDFDDPPDKSHPLYTSTQQHASRFGAAASIIGAYKGERLGCEAELGYKAQGFLPGYSLKASPVVRLFLSLFF